MPVVGDGVVHVEARAEAALRGPGGVEDPDLVGDPETGQLVADDIAGQTEQTFRNFNAVVGKQSAGVKPVRTTVRADLIGGMLVEVTAIARLGRG